MDRFSGNRWARHARPVALVVLTMVVVAGPGVAMTAAQSPAAPRGADRLHAFLWLAGQWRTEEGTQLSEETWSVPHGGSMVGMWRLVVNGAPRVIELLSLGVEGDAVVLRLRHFDAQLVAREEKGSPFALKLVEAGEKSAVFQGPGTDGPLTISYRVEGNDLVGVVRHAGREPETYRMRRATFGLTGGVAR